MSIDVESNVASCEAGVVLEALETALAPYGMTLPIDLGAKGSCHVGGNVATNAGARPRACVTRGTLTLPLGGVHLLRYGNLHGSVLGLEVVQADGTVLDLDTHLRKDNTGFDLKQLFIGSEGTLGVITRVTLAVPPLPRSRSVAFLACDSFAQVRAMLRAAKQELGEVLSAFEMMDSLTVDLVVKHIPNVPNPLAQPSAFYVLVEVAGSNASHDEQKLAAFTERVLGHGTASDGILAQDVTQMRALWRVREAASQATLRAGGFPFKYDLSLPLDHYYAIVEKVRERVGSSGVVIGYGHVGDSNLHLNVASNDAAVVNQIEPFVWEYCRSHRGSISAEHGVGLQKVAKLHYSKVTAMFFCFAFFFYMGGFSSPVACGNCSDAPDEADLRPQWHTQPIQSGARCAVKRNEERRWPTRLRKKGIEPPPTLLGRPQQRPVLG